MTVIDFLQMESIVIKEEQTYTSCYCEENVWWLCKRLTPSNLSSYVIFVSNDNRTVPLWKQSAAQNPDAAVVWDYHVILAVKSAPETLVFDLDTTLSYPCPFRVYADATFPMDDRLPPEYKRMFRVVPTNEYLANFASNRSHMKDVDDPEKWLKPPPSYDCILTQNSEHNLDSFISMKREEESWGKILNFQGLLEFFAS